MTMIKLMGQLEVALPVVGDTLQEHDDCVV